MRSTYGHLFLLIFLLVFPVSGDEPSGRWLLELSGGAGSGWWIYDRGSDSPGVTNNLGWDRTPHSPVTHLGASLLLRLNRFYLGAGLSRDHLFEKRMWAFEDGNPVRDRFQISTGKMPIRKTVFILAADVLHKPAYRMQPEFRYGTFSLKTLHPDRDNFTNQRLWQIGISNIIISGRWELIFRPFYSTYQIGLKDPPNREANHRIYQAGALIAFRRQFF